MGIRNAARKPLTSKFGEESCFATPISRRRRRGRIRTVVGDAAGQADGVNGEDSRTPYPWHRRETWDAATLARYRELIALRHRHPALRHGGAAVGARRRRRPGLPARDGRRAAARAGPAGTRQSRPAVRHEPRRAGVRGRRPTADGRDRGGGTARGRPRLRGVDTRLTRGVLLGGPLTWRTSARYVARARAGSVSGGLPAAAVHSLAVPMVQRVPEEVAS